MKNRYEVCGEVTRVFWHGQEFIVDTEDLEKVKSINGTWHIAKNFNTSYVLFNTKVNQVTISTQLHRFIYGISKDDKRYIDHINGNGLDNRKCNLRPATNSENRQNTSVTLAKSGHQNVYMMDGKWCVGIKINQKRIWLGRYTDYNEACQKAKEARARYFPFSKEAMAI